MAYKRFARASASWAGLFLLCFAPASAQSESRGFSVQPVRPGIIEAKSLTSITAVFRIKNETAAAAELKSRIDLPEGWKPVIPASGFRLAGGEETVKLVSVFIPVQSLAGVYRIGYAVESAEDPQVSAGAEIDVRVLLEAGLDIQAMDIPPFAVAGDVCTSKFLVLNRGNAPLEVNLDVLSNGFRLDPYPKAVSVGAGLAVPLAITVHTDRGIRQRLQQLVRVKAETKVPGQGTLTAEALTQQDIIPRAYGRSDYFTRVPLMVGFVGMSSNTGGQYAQFRISGNGALDETGRHKVDLYMRGPGRNDFNLFGLQREEYRFRYESEAVSVNVGDKSFTLTNLTQLGNYGRGVEAVLNLDRWMIRGFYEHNLFLGSTESDKALQLRYAPTDRLSFQLSYLDETGAAQSAGHIFSLHSRYSSEAANVALEYSYDTPENGNTGPGRSALWLEADGRNKFLSYRANVIQSGAGYNGYYRNLYYRSAAVILLPRSKVQFRASYLDQRRNTAIQPYFPPFYDRTIQAGLQWQAKNWLLLSLERRAHDRRDLSENFQFNYRDRTFQAGALVNIGSFNLQYFVDYGKTYNELTQKYERLVEYTLGTNLMAIDKLSLGAYAHYRDQDESFTGEKERQLELNFNVGFRSGRTSLNAFCRTAIHQDLYRSVLSERDFEDPVFLLNNYDLFGASLTQRFGNGHQLSVRVQRAANAFAEGSASKQFIGMVEYSIPLGVPVSRKKSIGMLRGKVFDAENGRKGIEGVIVKANDFVTVTDAAGKYIFNGLQPGPYSLSLEDRSSERGKITLEKMPVDLKVEGGRKLDCFIGLATGASITGRIMVYKLEKPDPALMAKKNGDPKGPMASEPETGAKSDDAKPKMVESAPLVATALELVGEDEAVYHALSDVDGRFMFEGLRPGKYTLTVFDNALPELHAFEKDTFTFELKAGSQEEVEIRVYPIIRQIQIIQQGEVTIKKKDPVDVSETRTGIDFS